MTALARAFLLAAVAVLVAAAPALAVAPSVADPSPGQKFTTATPTFDGNVPLEQTQGYPLIQSVSVRVTGPGYDQTVTVGVTSVGTWSTKAFTLPNGSYAVRACNADQGASPDCSPSVAFYVAVAAPGDYKLTADRGTMDALDRGKYPVTFRCAAGCDASLAVTVSPKNARRIGLPKWKTNQTLASLDVEGGQKEKTVHLSLAPKVARYVRSSFQFHLFKRLPVTVSADFGKTDKSVSTSLAWPRYHARLGRAFDHRIFLDVSGPKSVSLDEKFAVFHVRIAAIPSGVGPVFFSAAIFSAGGHFTSSQDNGIPASVARHGGTFTLKLPVAGGRGVRPARKVAPLAAVLRMGLLRKQTGKTEDAPDFNFTLTK